MKEVFSKLYNIGIVPVIKIDDITKAVALATALSSGGLTVLEITFRTEFASEAIREIKRNAPGVTLIAGTVLSVENAKKAVDAGAEAIVAPGLNPQIVNWCNQNSVPVCPGVSTASEIEQAMALGIDFVKFFPAQASGGLKAIKSLSAPYSNIKFMPTGGIDEGNINEYLAFDKVVACGGSWMVREDLIKAGNFAEIERLASSAVQKTLGIELAHVGINCENEREALISAEKFEGISGFELKNGNSSIFLGGRVEFVKSPYLGKNGHIALAVNNLRRAIYYFESKGFEFNYESKKTSADGKLVAIYFKEQVGNFAIHLLEKV